MRSNRSRRVAGLVAVALLAAGCGAGGEEATTTVPAADDTTTTVTAQTTTTVAATTTTSATTTTAVAMDGIHAADTELGTILVDGDGFTLYVFTVDGQGESACYDACAQLWPPIPGDSAVSSELDAALFGEIARDDGATQLTVNGMPLYRYQPDTEPGDVNGQGFNDVWFVIDASGNVVGPEAADHDAGDVIIDYDY